MLFLLIIFLLTDSNALRYLSADNTEDPYQVLIFFIDFPAVPGLFDSFNADSNLLGPGCVLALEAIEKKWNFTTLLGQDLSYKVLPQSPALVSESMVMIESQLVTKKYAIEGEAKSDVTLILGPIFYMVFLKPFCYANFYNCMFGIGKITTDSISAISPTLEYAYYQTDYYDPGNFNNNNINLEIRDKPTPILKAMFELFGWNMKDIVIIGEIGDSMDQAEEMVLALQEDLINHNIINGSVIANATAYLVNEAPLKSRVVLLFGSQRMVRDLMLQAYDAGMTGSNEYVFIIIPTNYFPLYTWEGQDDGLYFNLDQRDRDEDAHKAFQSAFIVTAEINTTSFDSFAKDVKERALDPPFNYTFPSTRELPLYAANYHDAVLLWAYAMNNYYDEATRSLNVSQLYDKSYTKDDFNGIEPVTGTIELDKYGDRNNSFLFWHLDQDGEWEEVGKYANGAYTELVAEKNIAWPNNGKSAPLAEPVCGFRGEKCPDNSLRDIGISVGVGAVVVLGLGLLVLTHMYRKAKFEAALAAMSWKIPLTEMRDCGKGHLGSSVFGTRSRITLGSITSEVSNNSPGNTRRKSYKQYFYFSRQARYQNKIVALKSVLSQYFAINRNLMIEMKTLKELRNENLLSVHGAVIEPDLCYLVTEYCNKGSLQDILENEDVKLDDMLNFSLINDLVKGMGFLHASVIGSHGYLKSSNCIINNHFSLKISDYSRSIFMSDMDRLHRANPETRNGRLVYRAPELLRMQCIPCQGTREGDMYSFGIVLHEILVREGPFGMSSMECDLTATEVINLVTKTDIQTPFRPEFSFTSDSKLARAIAMAREAWNEDPDQRPTFRALRSTLRSIRPDANISGGIVENLLSRMEKYATNLEEVVEERTAQLQVEKKRTDDLLESMLPKSVADQLKSGCVVPPEWFDCVSIYFSDIVGFTSISSLLKPLQVLDMLNDLYTVFDECIEKYDCYKVETIGDAYMVVSGLPIRNGDRHAAQIGLMSLDFLSCVNNFVIKHIPDEKLKIRIGMHSGPVVAGIVGTKMPRYCLFGDTVNTASRMESNGEALKIQMSEQSYKIMANHGGFVIEPRGLVDMKGKGKIPTYWLQGVEKDLNVSNPRNFTDQAQLIQKLNDSQAAAEKQRLKDIQDQADSAKLEEEERRAKEEAELQRKRDEEENRKKEEEEKRKQKEAEAVAAIEADRLALEELAKEADKVTRNLLTSQKEEEMAQRDLQAAEEALAAAKAADDQAMIEEAQRLKKEADERARTSNMIKRLAEAIQSRDLNQLETTISDAKKKKITGIESHVAEAEELVGLLYARMQLENACNDRSIEDIETALQKITDANYDKILAKEVNEAELLLKKLKRLEFLKRQVMELKQQTIAELKSYSKPPPVVKFVMMATFLILGHDAKDIKQWNQMVVLMGKTGKESLKRRVQSFEPDTMSWDIAETCQEILAGMDTGSVADVSAGAAAFYVWCDGMVEERLSLPIVIPKELKAIRRASIHREESNKHLTKGRTVDVLSRRSRSRDRMEAPKSKPDRSKSGGKSTSQSRSPAAQSRGTAAQRTTAQRTTAQSKSPAGTRKRK